MLKMAYNAKLIVQGSSGAKIYIIFKYANFGSLTAPDSRGIDCVIWQWNTLDVLYAIIIIIITIYFKCRNIQL